MEKEKIINLEETAKELFGEKATLSIAEIRVSNKGYVTRIKIQGLPFEISAMEETLDRSNQLAYNEFENQLKRALKNELFPTQTLSKYKKITLSDAELDRLYKYEENLGEEYLKEIKEKTIGYFCQIDKGRYECVLTSTYMSLNARGQGSNVKNALMKATLVAQDIFTPEPINVGKFPWMK